MKLAAILSGLFLTGLLFAAEEDEIRVEFNEIPTPAGVSNLVGEIAFEPALPRFSDDRYDIGEIVNIAKMVWKIIEANKPVVDVAYDYANAIPKSVLGTKKTVEGFSPLQVTSYRMIGKNYLDKEVYRITFSVVHRFGGNVEGVGHFIETAAVIPTNLAVFWGYTFEMKMAKVKVTNVGTAKDPVAAMLLEVACTIKTVVKEVQHRKLFEIRGDSAEVHLVE